VALTAGALVGERQRSLEAGINDFVSKPFDPKVLIRKVRRLVEHERGEPIPLVVLDEIPANSPGNGPLAASIDAGVVRQMFGGDSALFQSLLARLLRDYADLALPLLASLDDRTNRAQLKARTHKLKGSAGMIGATRVMQLAGAAESALEDGDPVEVVQGILTHLALALKTLREQTEPLLEQSRQSAKIGEKVPNQSGLGTEEVAELCALLESQNLAAIDKFALLSGSLREVLSSVRFDRLREAIDELEFQRASELLREALMHQNYESLHS
jgi:HPt (histidine-containing phosphotransfer) domain-containing protein